jgi:hypothetical protein
MICRSCGQEFGGTSAFDAHRIGRHEYTYSEGLKQDPPIEDGRRCRSAREMASLTCRDGTLMFSRNGEAWSLTKQLESARKL